MANNLSDYLEDEILDHILGTGSWTMPTSVKIGLFTTDPGEASGGAEVNDSGGSYARQTVAFDPSSGGVTQNAAEIAFPVATNAYDAPVAYVVLFNAATENRLWHGALTTPKTIGVGDQFKIADGDLDVSID